MRTHERVLARIEQGLAAGTWSLGDRLPPERALAEELGVSRPSVREAIRILEAMGIVRTAVGSGPSAGATVIDRPAAGLGAAVRLHVVSGTLPVSDVVATRVLLESGAVRDAAAAAPDAAALEPLRGHLATMARPGIGVAEFLERDQDLHLGLARLGGNQLVEAVLSGMRAAVASYVTAGAEAVPDWPRTAARLCAEHEAIVGAVARHDGDEAARLTREHIEGFYREAGLGDR
ncbi:FadR/GntR family transcriptional regulator [Promicromonospora thailandica]|uniref:DNA-binding transcriptional regulator, FadR family n=1 Tax=Promicromonospora thailandica TaxID=765201 RepID=A0A9X2G1D0_9MICO|nr:FCD domain-containing protein [Promicromonospora thailandica]MCP2263608.1 DNA-binding transcriptional regulator, FadR family [Promicromonospora thailandica]BFF19201.1 FCD domain-containing protein [Promicromonospora thailandica]